jgi:hypothetical protein
MPAAKPEADPTFGGELKETSPGMYEPAPKPTITSKDLQRYVKIAKTVGEMFGGSEPADAPRPPARDAAPEEQAAYAEQLVTYLDLDAEVMAAAGLQPGSPEYYEFIMQQADAVINQIIGGAEGDDLAAALRGKTQQELTQLRRALYVRGSLETLVGPGAQFDPFTGQKYDVAAAGQYNPGVAAYQRGLAGSVDTLAGKRGGEAREYLQGMLGRSPDLYGMQASADERAKQAALEEEARLKGEEEKRKRRGMLGNWYGE